MWNSTPSDNRKESSDSSSKSSSIGSNAGVLAAGALLGAATYFVLDYFKQEPTPSYAHTESPQTTQEEAKRSQLRNCSLCLTTISSDRETLPCAHSFHLRCLARWRRSTKAVCPMC